MHPGFKRVLVLFIALTAVLTALYTTEIQAFVIWLISVGSTIPPMASALVLFGLYCLKSVVMFVPILLLFAAAGILFPPAAALLLTYGFLTVELAIGYAIGKKLGRKGAGKYIKKYPKVLAVWETGRKNSFESAFLLRLIPGPPLEIVSLTMGAANIRLAPYLMGSLLGISPVLITTVLLGDAASKPLSSVYILPLAVGLAVFVFIAVCRRCLHKRNGGMNGE